MITILLLVAFTCSLYYFCTRKYNHWSNKNVKGPKPIPCFGNILQSAFRQKHIGIIYKEIYDAYPKEKVVGMFRMTSPTLIIRDLDVVKNILIKDFEVFPERGILFSKKGLGDNLFHCDIDTWRVLRKKFTPVFTSGKIKALVSVLCEHSDQFVNYLGNKVMKVPEQEMHQFFQKYTMSAIIAASFGLNVDLFNKDKGLIEKAGHYAFKSTYAAEMDMLFPNILQSLNLSLYNDVVNRFSYEILKTAVKLKNETPSDRNDAIDLMLTLKKEGKVAALKRNKDDEDLSMEVTDHVMAAQVFILFIAGFGNNALTLSYTLFYLAKHPEAQDKLYKEIISILDKHDRKLTYDAIKDMTYLDQVFSETLRLNPLTNSVQRVAARSYKIPESEIVIDKGTTVIISPYAIQRDERHFRNANVFYPERFSSENSKDWHPCSFVSFGAGPRSCLGRQLAKFQYAIALVKVLLRFKVEPSPMTNHIEDYDPMRTLIATKGGVYVKLIPRN